ncbi:MAG: cobalamin B12-binding domain-containing protein, partial [Acidobacteria bacterium]|nr:cobalamin B12-binding domain-containing protein [Acidobacteriota bacterium]
MHSVLISTYEMGRQPFGLASAAAWLRDAGWTVTAVDVSKDRARLDDATLASADLVAFHLPMHTATRLAEPVIVRARRLNATARLCAFGLYAPLNAEWLRSLGVDDVLGGEFEAHLAAIARRISAGPKDPPYISSTPTSRPGPKDPPYISSTPTSRPGPKDPPYISSTPTSRPGPKDPPYISS